MDTNYRLFKFLHFVIPPAIRPVRKFCQYGGKRYFGISGIINPPSLLVLFREVVGGIK